MKLYILKVYGSHKTHKVLLVVFGGVSRIFRTFDLAVAFLEGAQVANRCSCRQLLPVNDGIALRRLPDFMVAAIDRQEMNMVRSRHFPWRFNFGPEIGLLSVVSGLFFFFSPVIQVGWFCPPPVDLWNKINLSRFFTRTGCRTPGDIILKSEKTRIS